MACVYMIYVYHICISYIHTHIMCIYIYIFLLWVHISCTYTYIYIYICVYTNIIQTYHMYIYIYSVHKCSICIRTVSLCGVLDTWSSPHLRYQCRIPCCIYPNDGGKLTIFHHPAEGKSTIPSCMLPR